MSASTTNPTRRGRLARAGLAAALALTCIPLVAISSVRAAQAASTLPTKIVNGDFQYIGMTQSNWDHWHSIWPRSINRNEVPDSVVWPVDSRWVYIFPTTGQYGGLVEGAGKHAIAGFDAQRFGWKSNDTSSVVEIRRIGATSTQYWAELVAETSGKYIYQDVRTTPGTLYKWSLKHAASASTLHHDPSKTTTTDRMQVMIGSQTAQIAQSATRTASNGIDPVGVKSTTIASSVRQGYHEGNSWNSYAGTYIVPAGQTITRFTFQHAGTTANWSQTGNRIDDIHFAPYQPLIYDLNGGSASGLNTTIAQAQANDYAGYFEEGTTKALASVKPTRTGYTFLGWSKTKHAACTSKSAYDNIKSSIVTSITMAAGTNTVYAVWGKNPTATFKDGTAQSTTLKTQTVTFGAGATAPQASRTGYTFTEWDKSYSALYADTTITAKWRANTYKIAFNANGGAGQMSNQSMTYDKAAALTANAYTREGYTWQRWSTSPTGIGRAFVDRQSVSNLTASDGATVTLYAQWAKKPHVVYEDGWGEVISEQTIESGADATPPADPARPGYTFDGWSRPAQNITEDTTIYATWHANGYKIAYEANGGTGEMDATECTFDRTSRVSENAFTHTGYAFCGWNTKADGSGEALAEGQEITNLTDVDGSVVTLWAQWEPNRYTVRFDANEGTGEMADMDMVYGTPKQITKCAFARPGYTFQGWSLERGGAVAYEDEATTRNRAHDAGAVVYLYAVWEEDPPVMIQYAPADPDTASVTRVQDVVLPKTGRAEGSACIPDVGYKFMRWITPAGELAYSTAAITPERDGDGLYHPASYFAEVEPIAYKLTYDANGGSGDAPIVQLKWGQHADVIDNPYARPGFTFVGWNTARDGSGDALEAGQSVSDLTATDGATVTLYAQWVGDEYDIAYDANGGTGQMDPTHVIYGQGADLAPCAFEKIGHAFRGWNTEANGSGKTFADRAHVSHLTKDGGTYTLYAMWEACPYTIRFDANGGSGGMDDMRLRFGQAAELAANRFWAEGRVFAGWNTEADGTGEAFADRCEVRDLTAEHDGVITLYAQWAACVHTVIFEDGFGCEIGRVEVEHDADALAPDAGSPREGFAFAGWDKELSNITADTTITATWQDVRQHKGWDGEAIADDGTPLASTSDEEGEEWDRTADGSAPIVGATAALAAIAAAALIAGSRRRHAQD